MQLQKKKKESIVSTRQYCVNKNTCGLNRENECVYEQKKKKREKEK